MAVYETGAYLGVYAVYLISGKVAIIDVTLVAPGGIFRDSAAAQMYAVGAFLAEALILALGRCAAARGP